MGTKFTCWLFNNQSLKTNETLIVPMTADDDLKILGEGKKLSENKDEPNKSVDANVYRVSLIKVVGYAISLSQS